MNERPLNLRTTAQVIRQSSTSFAANLHTFLFLSLLLFSFRATVEHATLFLTSFIDRDPSLKALLSHLDLSAKSLRSDDEALLRSHSLRRRRPFLHLSRVGTLDENFFSGEDDDDRYLFGLPRQPSLNGTSLNLRNFFRADGKLGFSNLGNDDDLTHLQFKVPSRDADADGDDHINNDSDNPDKAEADSSSSSGSGSGSSSSDDYPFFLRGLDLGRRDTALLLFLVSFLSAAYGWAILGFLIINSCVLGVVFYTVVTTHLGRYHSFIGKLWVGSRLGIQRLSGFILIRWAVRDAMTQLIGICFFGEIDDQHSFFKLFVRLKLMPFSGTYPWISGYDSDVLRFLVTWTLSETVVALVFAVDYWVAIMDARTGKEIVREGFYLLSTMLGQAIQLKGYEAFLCGALVRSCLTRMFGNTFAILAQSVVEVYFMVVWLIYYFAAKCKDADRDGRRFERKDLEDYINGLR